MIQARFAGACVRQGDSVLMVREADPPARGLWSIPVGHVEDGETVDAAARREVEEETGLTVELIGNGITLEMTNDEFRSIPLHDDHIICLVVFEARPTGGVLRPGEDVLAVDWVPLAVAASLPLRGEYVRYFLDPARK